MNKTQVKGAAQKLTGEVQEGVGKAVKSDTLVAKGLGNRAAGTAKQTAGDAKSAVNKALK